MPETPSPVPLQPQDYSGPQIPQSDRYLSPQVKSKGLENTKEEEEQP